MWHRSNTWTKSEMRLWQNLTCSSHEQIEEVNCRRLKLNVTTSTSSRARRICWCHQAEHTLPGFAVHIKFSSSRRLQHSKLRIKRWFASRDNHNIGFPKLIALERWPPKVSSLKSDTRIWIFEFLLCSISHRQPKALFLNVSFPHTVP